MIRQYFLAESLDATEAAAELLHQQLQVNDNDLHVLSRDTTGLKQRQLHQANLLQHSDLIRGAGLGAMSGFVFSLALFCCAVLAMAFQPEVPVLLKNAIFIASIVAPILLGAVIGAAIGATRENHRISRFQQDLANGHYLLMVDTDKTHQAIIQQALVCCNLVDGGSDSSLILPFPETETLARLDQAA